MVVDLLALLIRNEFDKRGPSATVKGIPLIELAMAFKRFDLVQWLMNKGATVALPDHRGRNALHFAEHGEQVEPLVKRGAAVGQRDRSGRQPLHAAARAGRVDVMEALVKQGADVHAINAAKRTPLHLASARGHDDAVSWLLAMGSDVHAEDRRGHTPLWLAAIGGHENVVQQLATAGANLAQVGADGLAWWFGAPQWCQNTFAALCGDKGAQATEIRSPWSPSAKESERLLERLMAERPRGAYKPPGWSNYHEA